MSEQAFIKIVEEHFDKSREQLSVIKKEIVDLRSNHTFLTGDILPIYEKLLVLTGSMSELKIAFRINGDESI